MKKPLLLLMLTLLGFMMGKDIAVAKTANQACDPNIYRQISSRAWLEAEREIMQNQNLIFKADSVLEYTCFDQHLGNVAKNIGKIFTHTAHFGGVIIDPNGPNSIARAIETAAFFPLLSHIEKNFNHTLLGGRADHGPGGISIGVPGTGTELIKTTAATGNVSCDYMAQVWKAAKCMNFVHNDVFAQGDGFYPFETIVGLDGAPDVIGYADGSRAPDVRIYPAGMECTTELGYLDQKNALTWESASALADNRNQVYQFQKPLGQIFEYVFDSTLPGNCGDPIPTGVRIVLSTGPAHLDGVCTNPGCTYVAGGNNALGTCQ